jgi:hypothetical protein
MAAATLLGTVTWTTTAGNKTVTATPAASDLIVVIAAATGTNEGNAATTDVTDNNAGGAGTFLKLVDSVNLGLGASPRLTAWVRNSLIGSGTSTIFTATQANSNGGGLAVVKITGMTRFGLNAIRRAGIANGAATSTPTVALVTPVLTANCVIGGVVNETNAATLTAPGSWTEIADAGYATPTSGLEVAIRNSGETGSTITWGNTSSLWRAVVLELDITALAAKAFGTLGVGGDSR